MGITMNNIEKLEALGEGLKLSLELGIKKLFIVGDSQIIMNGLRKWKTPNWIINSKLKVVLILLDKFDEIRIKHMYWEGEKEVD